MAMVDRFLSVGGVCWEAVERSILRGSGMVSARSQSSNWIVLWNTKDQKWEIEAQKFQESSLRGVS